MAKLKLGAITDDKPVKLTVELPADVHRDLAAYTDMLARETGQSISDPAKLVNTFVRQCLSELIMVSDRPVEVGPVGTPDVPLDIVEGDNVVRADCQSLSDVLEGALHLAC